MKFVENVSKEDYINFCNNYKDMSFSQSYEWGEFNLKVRNQTPFYLGVYDDGDNLIAAGCFNKKKTPLNMCYIYAPRGFMIDYNNKELLNFFTKNLKSFAKKQNAIYIKIDPEIMYQEIDENGKKVDGGKNNYLMFQNLIDLGYKHGGFNKLFEKNQPRYTYRIDLKKSWEDVEKGIHSSFLRTIRRNYFYEIEIGFSDDVKTFYELHQKISQKDNFSEYSFEYYQEMYNLLKEQDNIKIHSATIYPDKVLAKLEEELRIADEQNYEESRKNRLLKDKDFFEPLRNNYPNGLIIAMVISVYTKKGAWALYIGNDNIAQHTLTVNRLYYEFTKYAHDNNYDFIDLYGTIGDPNTTYKNLAGIHEYKRKFGGTYTEFVGEFDLVNKPIWNFLLPKLLWIYRKIKR